MPRIELASAKTDKDTHFTTAIAANGGTEEENLAIPSKVDYCAVHQIRIIGDEALDFRLMFFATDGFADTDLDADTFLGWVDIDLENDGVQIGGSGPYYLDARLAIPLLYRDDDRTQEFHIALQNNSTSAKTAGASGEVSIEIMFEPIH